MEILSVQSPKYKDGNEKRVLIRVGDSDIGSMEYTKAVKEVYRLSSIKHRELHCLFMDTAEEQAADSYGPRPFMVVMDGAIQAVGAEVTSDMMIEEAVPAIHVTQLVFDAQSEVSISGLRKNDRGNCQHYEKCLTDATRKNKPNVCPPTCATFYPEEIIMASDQTNMDE